MRLIKALTGNVNRFDLTVDISDGTFTTIMTLAIAITTENTQRPVFVGAPYSAEIPEDAPQGVSVGHVTATDQDTPSLSYSIVSGNEDNLFSIGMLTGNKLITIYSQYIRSLLICQFRYLLMY